ncbi:(5-formylfuran-3-yl)methyl phosphate synthase [Paraburkholderia jirisanensis]
MTALLASVRSADEAFDAVEAGAELIDLKEPSGGALGGVAPGEIVRIAQQLRARYPVKPISATIGDLPAHAFDEIAARVIDVGASGVDFVKVGVKADASARAEAQACLSHLAGLPAPVLPVLLCDEGIDAQVVAHAISLGFAGLIFDTAVKDGRTLFDCVDAKTLAAHMANIRAKGAMVGMAGSLGWAQLAQIRALAPDIAGFRSALCSGGRTARLDPQRVAQWADALHHPQGQPDAALATQPAY